MELERFGLPVLFSASRRRRSLLDWLLPQRHSRKTHNSAPLPHRGCFDAIRDGIAYSLILISFHIRVIFELVLLLVNWRPHAKFPSFKDLSVLGKNEEKDSSCIYTYSII
jgi:hypothetical protein